MLNVLDYLVLLVLLVGGLLMIRSGLKMLAKEDAQENQDTLCPPHKWEDQPDGLRCAKCGRPPGNMPSGRNWPPTFPAV